MLYYSIQNEFDDTVNDDEPTLSDVHDILYYKFSDAAIEEIFYYMKDSSTEYYLDSTSFYSCFKEYNSISDAVNKLNLKSFAFLAAASWNFLAMSKFAFSASKLI